MFNMLIVIVASGLLRHRVLCWVVASALLALLCSVQVLAQTSSVERVFGVYASVEIKRTRFTCLLKILYLQVYLLVL